MPAIVCDFLSKEQKQLTSVFADREGAGFMVRFDVVTAAVRANAACVRSISCRPAAAWPDALLTATVLELAGGDFVAHARFRLGLAQAAEGD
jgi:hypothetical protein